MHPRFELILAWLMKFLPVNITSKIGAILGRMEVLRAAKKDRKWVARFYNNLEQLHAVSAEKDKKKWLIEFGEEFGRLYAETTILQKIDKLNRIKIEGLENLQNRTRPTIFIAPHISNWEIILKVFTQLDNPTCALYEPRENEQRMKIVNSARLGWGKKIHLISTEQPMAMKKLQSMLKNNSNLFVLPDEEKEGMVFAPSLGRHIPYAGNRWMLSRLAVKFSADVIPIHVERVKSTHFVIYIDKKIQYSDIDNRAIDKVEQAKLIADEIDVRLNQLVRKSPHLWYWLPYLDLKKNR
ncbi:lipid A biosynthesis lauroyl acyltransferase [Thiomicrorhabdus immobilis]|uniref:Lipid A biosynthesis lauroyl acyltransferase n=1 Tax=Thiomicrorhabdus immobilis TaxID=2791037 RepID=A0ABN6CUT3_9GAMM|nr:lysophospholipid acyltransferase family protein [Thiomicrorhabdus immobilis]BCN92728.1 lipid A biosynthesis lauroyl acyltransferase [Thiomicrorhabdus immobilis]